MAGFPIEEALVAPALAAVAAFAVPRASRGVASRFLPEESMGAANVGATIGAALAVIALGVDALGPALVPTRAWSGALLAALVFVVLGQGLRGARAWRPLGAVVVASSLGLAVALGGLAARRVAAQADDGWWSIRLAPWNGEAYLAAGWSLAADSPERAEALATLGERAGIRASDATRLRSEIAAVEGDCALARGLYERAIVEHAREALESWERLELGALPVPEQLALRCGLGDEPTELE
ncbi:MAG: hypothetical protein MUE69_27465 [Myxococcota bacterium]|nr:hypothetical protein [Myxococcota bacterium]